MLMNKILKIIRICLSFIFIVLFMLVFLGGDSIPHVISDGVLYLQFIPSLISFFMAAGGMAVAGFIVVMIITLVAGRLYCGFLCPLGILQDGCVFISKKVLKKRNRYEKAHPAIQYPVLGITVLAALSGSFVLVNLLDPYSLFGKIMIELIKPGFDMLGNAIAGLLERCDIYAFSVTLISPPNIPSLVTITLLFIALLILSIVKARMYCTTICPVGTLLGLVSRFSLFSIRIDRERCTACGICERICRAECINSMEKEVDNSRCVRCFDCLTVCPHDAISYRFALKDKVKVLQPDPARRQFIFGTAATIAAFGLGFPLRGITKPLLTGKEGYPSTPPGSRGVDHFTSACTACHLCVSSCPTGVIQPGFLEYGLAGFMHPHMDYRQGFCLYECHLCGDICPTGAILPLGAEEKKRTKIGEVQFFEEKCIVTTEKQNCGACAEHCPTHAVDTYPKDGLFMPYTEPLLCIGCGACENVCPALPEKAIIVNPLRVHDWAEILSDGERDRGPVIIEDARDDFPF
jgi:ferredoxin